MEYLQLTQHILTENKIYERSFEDNCELVLNDLGNFNVGACLNEMNNDSFSFLQYFFSAFKTGIKKKWQTALLRNKCNSCDNVFARMLFIATI